jgi:hypothetical protein
MKNKLRTKGYIKLNHSVKSCTNFLQLQSLREIVIAFHKVKNNDDSKELMANFIERESELHPETTKMLNKN